jgi:chromosome segregation ATPase
MDNVDEDEDPVQVSHMVPPSHRDDASQNTEFGGVSQAVREVYRLLAEGANQDTVRLEMKLKMVQRDRERTEEKIEDLQDELEYLKERKGELEDRVEEYGTRESEYEQMMEDLSAELDQGYAVFRDHGKVQRAADASDHTPGEIIERLQDQNPTVPDEQFKEAADSDADMRSSQFTSVSSQRGSNNSE